MKIFKNKAVVGLLCILVGVLVAFIAIPGVIAKETALAVVYTASEYVEPGKFITDDMFVKQEIPAALAPENAAGLDNILGKRAVSVIYPADIFTTAKLTGTYIPLDTYSLAAEKNKMVMSISARNLPAAAAARILPGDVVSILALPATRTSNQTQTVVPGLKPVDTQKLPASELDKLDKEEPIADQTDDGDIVVDEGSQGAAQVDELDSKIDLVYQEHDEQDESLPGVLDKPATIQYPELQYLEVAAIVANTGINASVKSELKEDESNILPSTISFYVNEEQALRLAELERNGTTYIVFVARGTAANEYIPVEDKVLNLDNISQ